MARQITPGLRLHSSASRYNDPTHLNLIPNHLQSVEGDEDYEVVRAGCSSGAVPTFPSSCFVLR
jgi:hypothetical protein